MLIGHQPTPLLAKPAPWPCSAAEIYASALKCQQALVRLCNENTQGLVGLCLSPVDLAISKLAAGRPKDLDYVGILLAHGLVQAGEILALIEPLEEAERIRTRLRGLG